MRIFIFPLQEFCFSVFQFHGLNKDVFYSKKKKSTNLKIQCSMICEYIALWRANQITRISHDLKISVLNRENIMLNIRELIVKI